jgi:antirestriction protein ArdC
LTDKQRAERREQERSLVTDAVAELQSSEGWQRWLETRSRFHRYSFSNQILIACQRETATNVAGFRKWLELGYTVKRGEHGIKIWAPCPPNKKQIEEAAERGDQSPRTFFRLVSVFAQDQIEELPPPAVPAPISIPIANVEGDSLAEHLPTLVRFGQTIGSRVDFERIDRNGAHGYYTPNDKKIVVSQDLSPNQQVKTLIHELAHALVRCDKQSDDPILTYAQEELVVESIALSVSGVLGIDTSSYSIPYLAAWDRSADLSIVEQAAKLVNRLANRLEDVLV